VSAQSYERIDAVLRQAARELPRLPDWWPQFLQLPPDAPEEQRLEVYQAVREDGTFEEHEGDFLVCFTIDQILTRRGRVEPQPIDERMAQVNELYRLLAPDRKPLDEWSPLEGQPLGVWQKLFAEHLELYGETEMADLFRRHPGNLITATKFGQLPFFGSPPDEASATRALVQSLFDEVSKCVTSAWEMGPLRRRWDTRLAPVLTVTISPTPIEVVGGARDGKLEDPALSRVDLLALVGLFEEVRDFEWSVEFEARSTQSLCLWGSYRGCPIVMLTLYAGAREGDKPTLKEFQRKRSFLEEDEPEGD
jgi:hypothetical protein